MPEDFRGQNLRGRNFKNQDLRGADFNEADIRGAKFTGAKLAGAKFIGARAGVPTRWMALQVCISFALCCLLDFVGILLAVVYTTFLLSNVPQGAGILPHIEMVVIQAAIYFAFAWQGFTAKAWTIIAIVVPLVLAVAGTLTFARIGTLAGAVAVVSTALVAGVGSVSFAGGLALALALALTLTGAVIGAFAFALAFALAGAGARAPAGALALAIAKPRVDARALAGALDYALVIAIGVALAALLLALYVARRSSKEDEKFEPAHSLGLRLGGLGGTSFKTADLSDADFSGATLSHCDFSRAIATRTRFKGAKQLKRARLTETILNDKAVRDLLVAGQGHQNYRGKNLQGANLAGAQLCGADFTEADLSDADLHEANLKNANLTRSRFVGCNLRDAVVENALVTDIDIQRLSGLPQPPEQLRIQDNDGEILLSGSESREFFNLPAIVEVYVTVELTQEELGCYHFHLGEIHHRGVAIGVYLVGHRHAHGGSVLRFQAKSYDEIYQVLPDLLAPFRMAEAVDWERTIQTMPAQNRVDAITALAKMETRLPAGRWRFAECMAEIFRGYRQARVYHIREGRSQGLRIDVFTNQHIADRLSRIALPKPGDEPRIHIVTGGGSSSVQLFEGNYAMVDRPQQNFYGGQFRGCSFGDHNSLINYFGVVDTLQTVEEVVKQKLKEVRNVIENSNLPDDDKADAVDELNKLTAELEKPEKDTGRIGRYLNRIKEVASTAASILEPVVSLAKLLGFG